jgi:hypothetical protein
VSLRGIVLVQLQSGYAPKKKEPGEREKSERNLDYLQVSYRADMIAIVLVIATIFEPSAKKTPNGGSLPVLLLGVCFCGY